MSKTADEVKEIVEILRGLERPWGQVAEQAADLLEQLLAEIGLRHEAKDVELREAARRLLWKLDLKRRCTKEIADLRKALEGMEVE